MVLRLRGTASGRASPPPGRWRAHRGGARSWGPTGVIRRDPHSDCIGPSGIIRSSTSRGTTPRPTAPGPGRACPRRPSGRWPPGADWRASRFPGVTELEPEGVHRMNVFQGDFPGGNTEADGYLGTAPVDAFDAQWMRPLQRVRQCMGMVRGLAGRDGTTGHPRSEAPDGAVKPAHCRVQRGGSYLCHSSYCRRYRVSARFGSEPDSSSGNVGFRVAAGPEPGWAIDPAGADRNGQLRGCDASDRRGHHVESP